MMKVLKRSQTILAYATPERLASALSVVVVRRTAESDAAEGFVVFRSRHRVRLPFFRQPRQEAADAERQLTALVGRVERLVTAHL